MNEQKANETAGARQLASSFPLLQSAVRAEVGLLEKLLADAVEKVQSNESQESVDAVCKYVETLARIKTFVASSAAGVDLSVRTTMVAMQKQITGQQERGKLNDQ